MALSVNTASVSAIVIIAVFIAGLMIGRTPEYLGKKIEVFEMIGRGMTTKQIARRLTLSPKTIEAHREKIKAKLDLKNAAELNCRAVQGVLENG